jgi:NADPH2:quinone reductase
VKTSVLEKKDFQISTLKPNDVLIKNHSIGVNFIDIYFREGLYPWPQEQNSSTRFRGSWRNRGCWTEVENFKVGDRVAYAQPNNAYATHR